MILILMAIVLIIGAISFVKKLKSKSDSIWGVSTTISIAIMGAFVFVLIGIVGLGIGESECKLIETNDLVGIIQGESTYIFLDEEEQGYYVDGNRVQVVNKYGVDASGSCSIVIGDYDKIYVERYEVDFKPNIWMFNLMSGSIYKIYIPQNMVSE